MVYAIMASVTALMNGKDNAVTFVSSVSLHNKTHSTTLHDNNYYTYPATCNPRCRHGNCIAPNHCVCNYGWDGQSCDTSKLNLLLSLFKK